MSEPREPGQGALGMPAENLPATSNIYAPPAAALDHRLFQPTVPIYLLIGFILAVVLLVFSLVSWCLLGFTQLFPLVTALGTHPEGWMLMGVVLFLNTPVLVGTTFGQSVGMAVWQGCSFASLRRAYGTDVVRRGWASGIWWFIPGADLFMPLLCLRELRYLIQKPRERPDPQASFGKTLIVLEALLILDFLLGMTALIIEWLSGSPDESSISDEEAFATMVTSVNVVTPEKIMSLAASGVGTALSTAALVIAVRYFFRQKELYAHWQDDLYWESLERLRRKGG